MIMHTSGLVIYRMAENFRDHVVNSIRPVIPKLKQQAMFSNLL